MDRLRFHVAKLYRKSLVKLRKSELKRLKQKLSDLEYKELKDAIAILRKGRDYFTEEETSILQLLFNHSPKLRLAYLYSHRGSKHLSVELNIFKPQQNETYVALLYLFLCAEKILKYFSVHNIFWSKLLDGY